jgi:hypothetical protein
MLSDQGQVVPQDILDGIESRRAARESALHDLKAMTKEERLEACRAFVNATLERGDNLFVIVYPPWSRSPWREDGKSVSVATVHIDSDAPYTKPAPALYSHDFTHAERIAILRPMGKVDDWREKVPKPIVALTEDDAYHENETYEQTAGERLNKARLALGMDIETFYAPAGMTMKTAIKWEEGGIPRLRVGERRLKAIAEAHGIPLEWLTCIDRLNAEYYRHKAEKKAAAETCGGGAS